VSGDPKGKLEFGRSATSSEERGEMAFKKVEKKQRLTGNGVIIVSASWDADWNDSFRKVETS